MTSSPAICFVQASGQNAFFGELLTALQGAVEEHGWQTETAFDHFPQAREDLVCVFVPHEFVPLTRKEVHPSTDELRRTIALSTEQPGSTWFEEAAPAAARAGATIDINPLGVAELRRRDVNVRHLPLGYVRAWDQWGGAEGSPRPVDATFLGGYTDRRGRLLAQCGRVLSQRRSVLRLVDNKQPQTTSSAEFLAGTQKWRLLAESKVIVNIHRRKQAYFEWQRVVEAIANGCVVLTEHSVGHSPLVPGEHFVSASPESLPFVLEELLENDPLLGEIRRRAYSFLRDQHPLDPAPLLEAAADLAREPIPNHPRRPKGSLPLPPTMPPSIWKAELEDKREDRRAAQMALKRLVLGQRRLERRLERLERAHEEPVLEVSTFGPPLSKPPRVSVVITVYNYEQFVEDAARSVALSDYQDLELVVVDDASTDRSNEFAARALAQLDWLSSTLIRLPFNEGLPAARNQGVERSQGALLFMLDADNMVYPHAIGRLAAALEEEPDAALAYGILERFSGARGLGLMNWSPWSSKRMASGNYIDATALIRRTAFEEAGGFTTDERLYGWEDFALWCAFAQAGWYGVHVPQIVARYRAGRVSMISLTNIDTAEAWSALVERYPFLTEVA